jgi:preprotein translocase subunit SecG
VRQSWILAVVWCVVAIVVVMVAGPKHLSRKHTKQEEPSEISPKPSVYGARPKAEPQAQ